MKNTTIRTCHKMKKYENHNNGEALNETYEIVMNELNHNNYDLTTI